MINCYLQHEMIFAFQVCGATFRRDIAGTPGLSGGQGERNRKLNDEDHSCTCAVIKCFLKLPASENAKSHW